MSIIRDNKRYHLLNDHQPPAKKLYSSGDLLIKELALKQHENHVTLQSELSRTQNFVKSTNFLPITSYTTGCSSLKDFQKVNDDITNLDDLKLAGLTEDEIHIFTESRKSMEDLYNEHKNLSKDYIDNKLVDIKQKLEQYQNATNDNLSSSNFHDGNRHLREFAYSIKPDSIETKLLKFALNNKTKESKIAHPIDNLKSIEETLFPSVETEPQNIAKIRKRARKLADAIAGRTVTKYLPQNTSSPFGTKQSSKWDVQVQSDVPNKIEKVKSQKIYSCPPQNFYTVRNGEIVKLNDKEINDENIVEFEKRLSLEEIRKLPKYKNFEKGTLSNVLYLNNLPSITLDELKLVFRCYDKGQLKYRILEKRLKGKAFVYFHDGASAALALNNLLGVHVKGKPLIIEYGKKNTNYNDIPS